VIKFVKELPKSISDKICRIETRHNDKKAKTSSIFHHPSLLYTKKSNIVYKIFFYVNYSS